MADTTVTARTAFRRSKFRYLAVALLSALFGSWVAHRQASDLMETDVDRILKVVDFDHVPLAAAAASLGRQVGINVIVRRSGPDAVLETPVTLHLEHATFATVMDAIVSSPSRPSPLDWNEENGVVYVDDRETIEADPAAYRWHLYNVDDVLKQSTLRPPPTNPDALLSSNIDAEEVRWEEFKKLIIDTIDPPSWTDNGGKIAKIESWGGLLVIQQTPRNQRALQTLLANLRRRGH